jgi:hypothetical protein
LWHGPNGAPGPATATAVNIRPYLSLPHCIVSCLACTLSRYWLLWGTAWCV